MEPIAKNGNMKHIWDHARFYIKHLSKERFQESTLAEVWWGVQNDNFILKTIGEENLLIQKLFEANLELGLNEFDAIAA